jgi:hypothetical protein
MANRFALLALGSYLISMMLPALAVMERPVLGGGAIPHELPGLDCLIFGVEYWPGWVANPLLVVAALCYLAKRYEVTLGLLVFALASAVFAPFMLLHDRNYALRYPDIGYFLWVASIIALAIAAIVRLREQRSRTVT